MRRQRARSNIFNLFGITGNGITDTAAILKNYAVRLGPLIATIILLPFLLKYQKLYRLVGVFFLIAYISFIACLQG